MRVEGGELKERAKTEEGWTKTKEVKVQTRKWKFFEMELPSSVRMLVDEAIIYSTSIDHHG